MAANAPAFRPVVKAGGPAPAVVTVAINRVEFKQAVLVKANGGPGNVT